MSFRNYLAWRTNLPLPQTPDEIEQYVQDSEDLDDALIEAAEQRRVARLMAEREKFYAQQDEAAAEAERRAS